MQAYWQGRQATYNYGLRPAVRRQRVSSRAALRRIADRACLQLGRSRILRDEAQAALCTGGGGSNAMMWRSAGARAGLGHREQEQGENGAATKPTWRGDCQQNPQQHQQNIAAGQLQHPRVFLGLSRSF